MHIAVIGDESCGKTSLVRRIIKDLGPKKILTHGKSSCDYCVFKKNMAIKFIFEDFGGQKEYYDVFKKDLECVVVALAIFSVDIPSSVRKLENKYLPILRQMNDSNIYFFCNKMDLIETDAYKDNKSKLESDFERLNNSNGKLYEIKYVSAKTGENVLKCFDEILERALSDNLDYSRATIRCDKLYRELIGKMVGFWIEDNTNDVDVMAWYDQTVTKWRNEKYGITKIYYTPFSGNSWFIGGFGQECQQIWQKIDYESRNDAVKKLYDNLRKKDWHPAIISFHLNKKYYIKSNHGRKWMTTTDSFRIVAFC